MLLSARIMFLTINRLVNFFLRVLLTKKIAPSRIYSCACACLKNMVWAIQYFITSCGAIKVDTEQGITALNPVRAEWLHSIALEIWLFDLCKALDCLIEKQHSFFCDTVEVHNGGKPAFFNMRILLWSYGNWSGSRGHIHMFYDIFEKWKILLTWILYFENASK